MSAEKIQLAFEAASNVIPLISSAGNLLSRMLGGAVSLGVARAELRSVLVVGLSRLDAAEADDRERDRREDERVKRLQDAKAAAEDTKP